MMAVLIFLLETWCVVGIALAYLSTLYRYSTYAFLCYDIDLAFMTTYSRSLDADIHNYCSTATVLTTIPFCTEANSRGI